MTSGCNLDLVLLWIELKINEIEASYLTMHKVYIIFKGPFKFSQCLASVPSYGIGMMLQDGCLGILLS